MDEVDLFLKKGGTLFDVRSPLEFLQGTIPGAHSLPLFSDQERASVGTTYKQIGHDAAFLLGLDYVGPKMRQLVEGAQIHGLKEVRLFCWRGGMRSQSMAWLLKTAGFDPITLSGGYKRFRRWVLKVLSLPYKIQVLGGLTGSGKTSLLEKLHHQGEQVINLEALAHHRGSAFGSLGMPSQPSNEQLENKIAFLLSQFRTDRTIWVEDESRLIGSCKIPDHFYQALQNAPLLFIRKSREERLSHLLEMYGQFTASDFIHSTQQLFKKLGGSRMREIVNRLEREDLRGAADMLLSYYDDAYQYSIERARRTPIFIEAEGLSEDEIATIVRSR